MYSCLAKRLLLSFPLLAAVLAAPLANAQSSGVSLLPSALSFSGSGGTGVVSQNVTVTSANLPVNFTANAFSAGNWLTVTPSSGTTPAVLTVGVNQGALGTGTYGGFVSIVTPNGTSTIPVTLSLNSTGPSPIVAAPGSLTYSFNPNSTLPLTQTLNLNSSAALNGPVSVTSTTSNGGTFLSVNPTSVTVSPSSPGSVNVSVNPSGLAPGVYSAVVAFNPPGTTGITVPVQVNITGPGTVNVAPSSLNFAWQLGTTTPTAAVLNVTTSGSTPQSFSAIPVTTNCGSNWLVVSPQSSATPATLSVQINPTGLQAGTCTGRIDITAAGAANPSISVPVNLLVSTTPLLQVPTQGPTFNLQLNSGVTPSPQSVQITSSGAPLPFTVTAAPVGNGPNFLTITPNSGTTPQAVQFAVNPSVVQGLAPNTYVVNVSVAATGSGNPAQTFPVTLVVSNNATLVPTQPSSTFNFQVGQAAPASQVLTLSSTGSPLNYNVTTASNNCPGFFTVSPTSGSTGNQFGTSTQLVISANTTGLTTAQTCTGSITVSVPGSNNTPLTIPVTLNVATAPLVNVSVPSINATVIAGNAQVQQQFVSVTSTDPNTALNFTATAATNPAGLTWLAVAPNSGSTPSVLTVVLNPANLTPGVYQGTITVSTNSANAPTQNIPVTLTVASAQVSAAPAALTFTQSLGGPSPATQTVNITGLPQATTIGATASIFNGSGWLTVAQGNSPGTLTVTANGANLSQGTYTGVITVVAPGTTPNPLYIPVTLTVGNALSFVLGGNAAAFNFQTGSATVPDPQVITVAASGGAAVPFTAVSATSNGGNFFTVTPSSGTTPGQVSIALNQSVVSNLGPGTYAGTVTLSSPNIPGGNQVINVTLTVAPPSAPSVTSIVNAASNQPGAVAPGEIIAIYGNNIGPTPPQILTLTSSGMVGTNLGNTTVTFDGVPAPLLYAGPNQINAVVPYEIAGRVTTNLVVQRGGQNSASISLRVTDSNPAIFTQNSSGTGPGSILNQDYSLNRASSPAAKGSIISIYATGEGQLVPGGVTGSVIPSTGNFPTPVGKVSVTIGGVPADVVYAGAVPTLVSGVLQVNVRVPSNVASGAQPVVVTVGNASSLPVVTVAVQ